MKKLIILFCGTLALAACGNGLEKKANDRKMSRRILFYQLFSPTSLPFRKID